jgi:DNA repair protein RecO (recombination protein O)
MLKESEALILRSYPLREADLLVSFFTRSEGKVRGVARSAKRSKRRFGGALEPLTHVRAFWDDRERHELARLDACEVLRSPLSDPIDYPRATALAHVAEVLDELLPDREANDAIFRLAVATLPHLQANVIAGAEASPAQPARNTGPRTTNYDPRTSSSIWMPLTYFDLWITRLTGLLPDLSVCVACGNSLNGSHGSKAFFHPLADGLLCATDRRLGLTRPNAAPRAALARTADEDVQPDETLEAQAQAQAQTEDERPAANSPRRPGYRNIGTREMSAESRNIAAQMLSSPIERFTAAAWPADRARDLRRFLAQLIERHIEKRLATVRMLEKL